MKFNCEGKGAEIGYQSVVNGSYHIFNQYRLCYFLYCADDYDAQRLSIYGGTCEHGGSGYIYSRAWFGFG